MSLAHLSSAEIRRYFRETRKALEVEQAVNAAYKQLRQDNRLIARDYLVAAKNGLDALLEELSDAR